MEVYLYLHTRQVPNITFEAIMVCSTGVATLFMMAPAIVHPAQSCGGRQFFLLCVLAPLKTNL